MLMILQSVGMITLRFCSIFTWQHHRVAADLMAAHGLLQPVIQKCCIRFCFSSDQAMTFFYTVLFCWAHMSLGIMFFCCCCPSASRFNVLCWLRDNLLHTLVVVSAYLRCYCLPISSTKASFSPLTSGKSKGFLSRQLDIFSSSDIFL